MGNHREALERVTDELKLGNERASLAQARVVELESELVEVVGVDVGLGVEVGVAVGLVVGVDVGLVVGVDVGLGVDAPVVEECDAPEVD